MNTIAHCNYDDVCNAVLVDTLKLISIENLARTMFEPSEKFSVPPASYLL